MLTSVGPAAAPLQLGLFAAANLVQMTPGLGVNAIIANNDVSLVRGTILEMQRSASVVGARAFLNAGEPLAKMGNFVGNVLDEGVKELGSVYG